MKHPRSFIAFTVVSFLFVVGSTSAQEQSTDHVFVSTTFQTTLPEGGTFAERDSLLNLYHKQVTEKNTLVLSQRAMQHYYGHNSHDLVFVTEYKNWGDIDAASKMDDQLFEKYWTDEAARRHFNRTLGKYFTGHADEIYSERTKLRK